MTSSTRLHKAGPAPSPDNRVAKLQQALEACQQERNAAWTRLLELQVEHEARAAEWSARLAETEARADLERADHAGESAQLQQTVSAREAELQTVNLRLAERDQRIDSLSQEIDEAVRQRQQGERELREAASQIVSLQATIAALQAEIDTARETARVAELQLSELHRSSSWRITAPFRVLKRRGPGIRSLVGSWLQALYLALPLPWSVKLRIKGLLFALFSPLLRHTHAYQAWLAFESARRQFPPSNQ